MPPAKADPVERLVRGFRWRLDVGGFEVGGVQRVGEEGVLDVGGDEFEMLLLVFEAQGDAARRLRPRWGAGAGWRWPAVDVGAVGEDGVEGRPGEGGAKFFGGHVAEGVVVAIEEPEEVRMEGLVGGDELAE